MRRNKIFRIGEVWVFLALIALTLAWYVNRARTDESEDFCTVRSDDKCITASWGGLDRKKFASAHVYVYDDGALVYDGEFLPEGPPAVFYDGQHGKKYSVMVLADRKPGLFGHVRTDTVLDADYMYLDYDMLPDLPVLRIETKDSRHPGYTIVSAPKNAWGTSVTDNEYVDAEYCLTRPGGEPMTGITEIKVRGNASNMTYNGKLGYRLRLRKKEALSDSDELATKHWALLSVGHYINTYVGETISELAGVEFSHHMMFVNVIVNGDWKGTYCLTPSVSRANAKDLISEQGYLFESDAYWWKEGEIHFRTGSVIDQMSYTITYPDVESKDDVRLLAIRDYLQEFEDLLYAGDEGYRDYIDEESFARWLIVRDVMGEGDAAGANTYYYKYDFDPQDPTSTPLKMGPVWDFDNMAMSGDS